jgi:hypothetical protein
MTLYTFLATDAFDANRSAASWLITMVALLLNAVKVRRLGRPGRVWAVLHDG